jgi:predicted ATPase
MVFALSPDGGSTYAGHSTRGFYDLRHGESFLEILRSRFDSRDLDCLDEPGACRPRRRRPLPGCCMSSPRRRHALEVGD